MSVPSVAGRRVATVVASLALISLGVMIRGEMPKAEDRVFDIFEHTSSPVPMLGDVSNVRLTVTDSVNNYATNGVWAVVDFDYTQDMELGLSNYSAKIEATDGTTYDSVGTTSSECGMMYPGLRTHCTLVFEMPREKTAGATLHFGLVNPMGLEVVLPLGEAAGVDKLEVDGFYL